MKVQRFPCFVTKANHQINGIRRLLVFYSSGEAQKMDHGLIAKRLTMKLNKRSPRAPWLNGPVGPFWFVKAIGQVG